MDTTIRRVASESPRGSLDNTEKDLLNEIAQGNHKMIKKLKFDTMKYKKSSKTTTEKKRPVRITEKDIKEQEKKEKKKEKHHKKLLKLAAGSPKAPRAFISQSLRSPREVKPAPQEEVVEVSSMRKKVEELEKMQEMYRQRISELEQQVSSFSVFHIMNNQKVIREVVEQKAAVDQQLAADGQPKAPETKEKVLKEFVMQRQDTPTSALPIPAVQKSLFEGHQRKDVSIPTQSVQLGDIPVASIQSKFLDQFSAFPKVVKTPSDIVVKPKLLALYDYKSDLPGRLSFSEGQILFLRKKSSNGWWTAELNGRIGKIPSNYVETLQANKAFRARVIKDFEAVQPGDIGLKRGELVTVLKKQDNGWWLGEKGGKTGFFPSKHAEKIVNTENSM